MLPRDRGTIIQVGSALAFRLIPLESAYCANKHAIQRFTESLRAELIHRKSNVGLSVVNMPALNTTQFVRTKTKRRTRRPTGTIFQLTTVPGTSLVYTTGGTAGSFYFGDYYDYKPVISGLPQMRTVITILCP